MKSEFDLVYQPFGEHAILVTWPEVISEEILKDILRHKRCYEKSLASSIIETVVAYNSLTLFLQEDMDCEEIISKLKEVEINSSLADKVQSVIWSVPVCYDKQFGIDLAEMSDKLQLSIDQIISLHASGQYLVHFIGFLPGFMYLGGLDKKLHCERKSKPRNQVARGAVAIGGQQTGVYPVACPAGWNILGNSPLTFFDHSNAIPCFAKPGDQITFRPISVDEHKKISLEVATGIFDWGEIKAYS